MVAFREVALATELGGRFIFIFGVLNNSVGHIGASKIKNKL